MTLPTEESDDQVIAAILGGDTAAFAVIAERYEDVVARTVIAMLGVGDEAEEAGQVTMIKLYRNLEQFKKEASLKTYVTKIAMNTALDALRRRKRTLKRFLSLSEDNEDFYPTSLTDACDNAVDIENRQLVAIALSRLKPEFRSVVVLRLMHGYSSMEVASMLNISQGAVFSRLSRARGQLKEFLGSQVQYAE